MTTLCHAVTTLRWYKEDTVSHPDKVDLCGVEVVCENLNRNLKDTDVIIRMKTEDETIELTVGELRRLKRMLALTHY